IDRTVYGRWMYPVIGPIAIGLVSGWRSFAVAIRRHPHAIAAVFVVAAIVLGFLWFGVPGNTLRLLIRGNHYGDTSHLTQIVTLSIVFLGALGGLVEAGSRLRKRAVAIEAVTVRGQPVRVTPPVAWLSLAVALNVALLFAFVAPAYRDLDAR